MKAVEIDFVVPDSLQALALYEAIFEVERLEVSQFPVGLNEVVFSIYGTRFHMLDENPEYQLVAPKPGDPKPMWFNVMVPDIQQVFDAAMANGCQEMQPVTEMAEMGLKNGFFVDPFGYLWMVHEIVREVSYEERIAILERSLDK